MASVLENGEITFYDSNTGDPLFYAPRGRTFDEFVSESKKHGWPSFRDEEVNIVRNKVVLFVKYWVLFSLQYLQNFFLMMKLVLNELRRPHAYGLESIMFCIPARASARTLKAFSFEEGNSFQHFPLIAHFRFFNCPGELGVRALPPERRSGEHVWHPLGPQPA